MSAKQSNISAAFAFKKSSAAATAPTQSVGHTATVKTTNTLTSADPIIQEFYNGLTPYERITHTIAIEKLGTSYDVTRTHGFLKWKKARA
jgi:hypothetical protein